MSQTINWKYIVRTCCLIVLGVALFTCAGWYNGDKAFEEFVRKIRVRNQQRVLEDVRVGIPMPSNSDVEVDKLLLERQGYSGLTTAKCFAIAYAYQAFWISVSVSGCYYAIRLLLAMKILRKSGKPEQPEPS